MKFPKTALISTVPAAKVTPENDAKAVPADITANPKKKEITANLAIVPVTLTPTVWMLATPSTANVFSVSTTHTVWRVIYVLLDSMATPSN